MEDDDDDEFGDLYSDVLQPLSLIQNPNTNETLAASSTGGDQIPIENPSSDQKPIVTLAPIADEDPNEEWLPDNWNDDNDDDFPVANFQAKIEPEARVRVSASVEDGSKIMVSEEDRTEIGDLKQELVIPGISAVPSSNNGDFRVLNSEDWDSDSEDDLQIVLNDNTHMPIGGERIEDGDVEDLVIVTGEDQHALENHAWGEGDLQPSAADGEIKEGSEAAKANGAAVIGSGGPRIGYNNHGLHLQHHSMFKYVRPGAAAPGNPPVVTSGQIRPPSTMSSIAGRGRGDWRPAGIGGIPGPPKNFHSGFRSGWANNTSRAFGGGLDFTLPSYKTVFDIDIEIFEEKPWRHPEIDISDYFNFGLDEDSWKEYSKQLDQLRLESTMQSKIRVYESGRSEQAYDPDLPPELAAATGHHDISADNIKHIKIDNGQSDLSSQGRDASYSQGRDASYFQLTGRAIQVETGYGERLPSVDTRLPRPRDSDVVIEIPLQDPMEDTTVYNNGLPEPGKDIQGEEHDGVQDAEGDRRSESECYNRFPRTFNGYRREMGSRKIFHAPERDGSLPFSPESPHYNSNSRLRSPVNSAGSFGTHHGGRLTEGASRRKYSSPIANHTNDSIPPRSTHENRPGDHHIEKPIRSMEASHTSEQSPAIAAEMVGELGIEQKDGEDDGMLALDDGVELEEETSDLQISGETPGDDSIIHSSKKQKLSSRVEQTAIRDSGEDDGLRATHSDNSIAKSGSSNQQRRESGDDEVQKARSRRAGDLRRRHDDYGREGRREMDRMRMGISGREAMHHSYPHRDWEPYSAHNVRGRSEGFERPRESDRPFWQRREDDIHSRRMDEDLRREPKIRVGDRNNKDDDAHLKKRLDDRDWRERNREGGPKLRDKDDVLHRRGHLDDHHTKRKKDEDHLRRERTEKEESSRRKRERDDNTDNRKREDGSRIKEKAEEHHSSKHKDESWHQREREDRQRLKHPHEDPLPHRERSEGRGATRSGRTTDDKSLGGSARDKSDSIVIVSDKDNQHRDKRHHKGREDAYGREKSYNKEERSSRHERLSVHGSRPSASDSREMSRERHREGTRRNKDTEIGTPNPPGLAKRKNEDRSAHHTEKVSSKGLNEQEGSRPPHSSEKQGQENLASDGEGQRESKRGRSKVERWTSHKEREYNDGDIKDVEDTTKDIAPTDELPKTEGNDASDSDRHLDTVEKLKRRSERFKLPMPVEKDVSSLSKRSENEAQSTLIEPLADNEVKPERPARKRRWTTS